PPAMKPGTPAPAPSAPQAHPESEPAVPVPEFERDLEDRVRRPIPFERAVLFSMAAHLVAFLFILFAPAGAFRGSGLLAAFLPSVEPQENIPIVLREAAGPARGSPRK